MDDKPNLIERLENLVYALNEATDLLDAPGVSGSNVPTVNARIEDAKGIAGEVLTMLDGR